MAVEIKEIVIRAILKDEERPHDPEYGENSHVLSALATEKDAVVQECVDPGPESIEKEKLQVKCLYSTHLSFKSSRSLPS